MTSISQLQMSYSPSEDRILLRMNTTDGDEFRFWLTRRFVVLMVKALHAQHAADPDLVSQPAGEAREAVRQFKQEAADARGNFAEEFRSSAAFPLGEAPLLAAKLSYRVEQGKLVLTIEPAEGKGINMILDEQLNFNVTRLLKAATEKADWGISLERQTADSGTGKVIN